MFERPHQFESSETRPIFEDKQIRAGIVLGWVTTGEVPVLFILFCYISIFFNVFDVVQVFYEYSYGNKPNHIINKNDLA